MSTYDGAISSVLIGSELYEVKDLAARQAISAGLVFEICSSAANTPLGVSWNPASGQSVVGTLVASADTQGVVKLVPIRETIGSQLLGHDEYVTIITVPGTTPTYAWEKLGSTQIELKGLVTGVTLNKVTDVVLGEGTTFTLTSPSSGNGTGIDQGTISTDMVLGSGTTVNTNTLQTTSVRGVKTGNNSTTTASKATAGTAVTVAKRAASQTTVGNANVGSATTVATGFTSGSTTTFTTNGIKAASLSVVADPTGLSGYTSYVEAVGEVGLTGTKTFNTDAIKSASLDILTTSADGYEAYVSSVSSPSLTGTTTFNTDAIKSASLDVQSTSATGYTTYVESVTSPTLGGTTTFAVNPTVTGETLTFTTGTVSLSGGTPTTKYMKVSTTSAGTGTVGISGGSPTTKYMKVSTSAASTGTVGISGGSPTTKYMKVSTTASDTGTVTLDTTSITPAASSTTKIYAVDGTETITPYSFTDVTVPIRADTDTTVATGNFGNQGTTSIAAEFVTGINQDDLVTAVTDVGDPSLASGTDKTITVTVGTNDKVTTLTNGTSLTVTTHQ